MSFYNKVKWVLGILMVFVLIVATNLIDRNNFLRVKDSVVTIYEDRLVVNDLIFEMSIAMQEKELAAIKADKDFFLSENNKINEDLQNFILKYEQTKLTAKEVKVFNEFKQNFEKVKVAERDFIASKFDNVKGLENELLKVKKNLYQLSKIQLNEGGRQMSISKKAIDTVELFTQLEIYILIFLAIVIQIIVIYQPKKE
ncbi:MCP four helix bundle domain-containing protein [Polaribacter sp. KT 15]|uniref:MCP four helix bundle domain-containing protein n=1 Tax=Polaribacter sp. KT 15 TaxID=1896175 RepID=UPI00090C027C|nr:MCP four helix bundle domain-containing protein [Polaribacter sp. KT 15]SHN03977.1 Four helix bundle sensory module for signal transduction [Polaribacter sp. KT 15]